MFDNIGSKIKTLASVICWLGIIGCVLCGIALMIAIRRFGFLIGLFIIIFGSLFSWISSFVLYGFGEIVENSDIRTELAVKSEMQQNR